MNVEHNWLKVLTLFLKIGILKSLFHHQYFPKCILKTNNRITIKDFDDLLSSLNISPFTFLPPPPPLLTCEGVNN